MNENKNIIPKAKLTDALPDEPAEPVDRPAPARPGQAPHKADPAAVKQHNAEVNRGIEDTEERLTEIGRAHQNAGRQGS
jgi:hypothetical protein